MMPTNKIFLMNACNPKDPKFLSKFISTLEDKGLRIWDIVSSQFDRSQAKYVGFSEGLNGVQDNSFFLFQCEGTADQCQSVLEEVDQTEYTNFFVKLLDTNDADDFLEAKP